MRREEKDSEEGRERGEEGEENVCFEEVKWEEMREGQRELSEKGAENCHNRKRQNKCRETSRTSFPTKTYAKVSELLIRSSQVGFARKLTNNVSWDLLSRKERELRVKNWTRRQRKLKKNPASVEAIENHLSLSL